MAFLKGKTKKTIVVLFAWLYAVFSAAAHSCRRILSFVAYMVWLFYVFVVFVGAVYVVGFRGKPQAFHEIAAVRWTLLNSGFSVLY